MERDDRENRAKVRYRRGWDRPPLYASAVAEDGRVTWSEDEDAAAWLDPDDYWPIQERYGAAHAGGRIDLLDEPCSHGAFVGVVGRDYWEHITT
jgi:hypothetical protein